MTTTLQQISEDQGKKEFRDLLDQYNASLPKVGDVITGTVLSVSKGEVHVDVNGIATGIVRGSELIDESGEYSHLAIGDQVNATVLELENERGLLELSFRSAGHKKAWDHLRQLMQTGEIVSVKATDANKGGLMISFGNVQGFMPVSQLCPEHYPRIQGGDKNKILEKLKSYTGENFEVKVIDASEQEDKLIVSEKAAWEVRQKDVISSYKVGDSIEGVVTVITDFGAFVEFGQGLEGLVHISEIAWQRIDDPKEYLHSGQKIKAQIIKIEGSKIFLSMKNLISDPWKNVAERYQIGQIVSGKVLKVNPFGLFVELDTEIHGLAHVSELSSKEQIDPTTIAHPGEVREFRIVSIEPKEHRLGLSIKALKEPIVQEQQTEKKEDLNAFIKYIEEHKEEFDKIDPTNHSLRKAGYQFGYTDEQFDKLEEDARRRIAQSLGINLERLEEYFVTSAGPRSTNEEQQKTIE